MFLVSRDIFQNAKLATNKIQCHANIPDIKYLKFLRHAVKQLLPHNINVCLFYTVFAGWYKCLKSVPRCLKIAAAVTRESGSGRIWPANVPTNWGMPLVRVHIDTANCEFQKSWIVSKCNRVNASGDQKQIWNLKKNWKYFLPHQFMLTFFFRVCMF